MILSKEEFDSLSPLAKAIAQGLEDAIMGHGKVYTFCPENITFTIETVSNE